MKKEEKILLDRMIFCAAGVILVIFLAVLYRIAATDASMSAWLDPVATDSGDAPCSLSVPVEEPEDSYLVSVLTFGGTCTPASMLGSSSYGTFNLMYSGNGAETFFSDIRGILDDDAGTVVGLSAVFSDRTDLVPAEKAVTEWYLAPRGTAEIFTAGGIDAVSLECARSGDYGADGLADTEASLDGAGIGWGSGERDIVFDLADGVTAVVCCAGYTAGCEEAVSARINAAAAQYDLVVLYITDSDDSYIVSDAKRETYRAFAEAGADVIVGTNGSKLQCIEEWQGSTIAYSLGALLDGATKYPEKYTALLRVTLNVKDGSITDINCEAVPLTAYDDGSSWHPAGVLDQAAHDSVLAFLSGQRDNPNP